MARYERIVFVCTNEGREGDEKARCGKQGGQQLLDRLKARAKAEGMKGRVRITRSGCLDLCARGCAALAVGGPQPDREAWYIHLTPDDADKLFEEAILDEKAGDVPALRQLPTRTADALSSAALA